MSVFRFHRGTASALQSYDVLLQTPRPYLTDQFISVQNSRTVCNYKKKNRLRRKARKRFIGAPNRIRTCGLLIRSQTLYPAELWVRSSRTGGIIAQHSLFVNTKICNLFLYILD